MSLWQQLKNFLSNRFSTLRSNEFKLITGYSFGGLVFSVCLLIALFTKSGSWLNFVLCLFGIVLGWLVGIASLPLDKYEKSVFSVLASAAASVLTGYIAATFQEPISLSISEEISNNGLQLSIRVGLFLSCFIVGFLFTGVNRLYGGDSASKSEAKIRENELRLIRIKAEMARLVAENEFLRSHPLIPQPRIETTAPQPDAPQ